MTTLGRNNHNLIVNFSKKEQKKLVKLKMITKQLGCFIFFQLKH